jgi:uncharacterized membrane protein
MSLIINMNLYYLGQVITVLVSVFHVLGILALLVGGYQAAKYFIREELKKSEIKKIEKTRYILGHKMLIGLEFILAGDIISTVNSPTWESIGRLGALIAIRTVLSYFLEWEVQRKKHFNG